MTTLQSVSILSVILSVKAYTYKVDKYHILSSIVCTFSRENDDEILSAHYSWKVVEKGFKIRWVMWYWERLAGWNILEKNFSDKNHCKIKVRTILVYALHWIKYGIFDIILMTLEPTCFTLESGRLPKHLHKILTKQTSTS
jgi:hypothetical protein